MQRKKELSQVLNEVKTTFVGKDEIVDLLAVCLVAGENLFLLGPPGTAKSAIVRAFASCIEGGKNFEYLLTRFTEPNELFGPFDIRKLKDGQLVTNTEGMMPEASMVFLDEIFNANSAILNSLLMALNEKIFKRGKETKKLPTLTFIGASNLLPEEEILNALLDRFLVRVKCDYVDPDLLEDVLVAGRELAGAKEGPKSKITPESILAIQQDCRNVDLTPVRKQYVDVVHHLRSTGIKVSDRRAVKLQNLIAASAWLSGREAAVLSDLWVLKFIWDTEDQIELLEGIINAIIEKDDPAVAHPQALQDKAPNAELILDEVKTLQQRWAADLPLQDQHAMKDKLRYLQSRSEWIGSKEQKAFIHNEINGLWAKML